MYLSKLLNSTVQLSLLAVCLLFVGVPSATNSNSTLSGLIPSTPSKSTHSLFAVTVTYSFLTLSSVGLIGVSSCFAFSFFICTSAVVNLFTFTWNVNVTVLFAATSTVIPLFKSASVYFPFPSTLILLATNVVPSGTVSSNTTEPFPFPVFVAVNVYLITSNSCNVAPASSWLPFLIPTLVFVVVMFATFVSTSSVGLFPSITALFVTDVFVSLLIVTLNETSAVFPAFTSTSVHVIVPLDSTPLFVIDFSTNVVPAGISSVTVTVPVAFPLFVNVIVYVNVSPTFASALSTSFLPVIFIIPVSVSSVVFPLTIAEFFIVPFSALTLTVNSTFSVSPGSTVTLQVNFFVFSSSLLSLFSNTVPSGTLSYIIAFATLSPLFFTLIVYVSVSPIFTLSLSTVLCISRFDFFAVKFAVDAIDANCVGPQPTSNVSQGFLTVSSLSVTYS